MRRLSPTALAGAWATPRYLGALLVVGLAPATFAVATSANDGGSGGTRIYVRPKVGDKLTQFKLRWRTPVRIRRHDQLQYDLRGPGYVSESGNEGCQGFLKATWFPATADETGETKQPGQLVTMTVTRHEIRGAEERGWCPGRYRGWVQLWKLKRDRGCLPETGRERCWKHVFIGSFQYTAKEANEVPPPIPVPTEPLLQYVSNGSPTSPPRGVTDSLWVTHQGAALVRLYGTDANPWRLACINERSLNRLKQELRKAARLNQDRLTRPFPRRGQQTLQFGRDGRRLLETFPAARLSPMEGQLRREVFQSADAIRSKTRSSDRRRPCGA